MATIVKKIVFLWENFGPYHLDRLDAAVKTFHGRAHIVGIELASKSSTYAWAQAVETRFERITIAKAAPHFFARPLRWQIPKLCRVLMKIGRADFFFCHYEQPAIFCAALFLRLIGCRVYIMNDMKYADFKRNVPREIVKTIFHFPYCGAIAAGRRSADYFRFMGIKERRIEIGYGAVSLARLDQAIQNVELPTQIMRPFIVVARFLPMKNITAILQAYRLYRDLVPDPRPLLLCGSGPLENEFRKFVSDHNLDDHVVFRGYLQADDVTRAIASSLCLVLFSTQETFGNVIIEALALGVPVIATPICGATDEFLKSGVNGFLVEPDNISGLANYMKLISSNHDLWEQFSAAARMMREQIDIVNFTKAIENLTCSSDPKSNLGHNS